MPSEQKGAYGGHLALSVRIHGEHAGARPAYVTTLPLSEEIFQSYRATLAVVITADSAEARIRAMSSR